MPPNQNPTNPLTPAPPPVTPPVSSVPPLNVPPLPNVAPPPNMPTPLEANVPPPLNASVPSAPNAHSGPSTRGKDSKAVAKKPASTQNTLLVAEIRDGLVIMRDGSLRAVIMCQSINFDLMSPQEREGVEFGYQGFLNSLDFPIQIFIRSQRVNLNNYINKLEKVHTNQENILLGLLMEDYIAYVRYLVESANIMDKQFYVIVPYYPPLLAAGGIATNIRKLTTIVKPAKETVVINETDFNQYKTQLTQQVQVVLDGMEQMGVQAIPLNTQELIELYYNVYNPETSSQERLTNVDELDAPIISKGEGQAPVILQGDQ